MLAYSMKVLALPLNSRVTTSFPAKRYQRRPFAQIRRLTKMIERELPFPGMEVARKIIFLFLRRMKHVNFS